MATSEAIEQLRAVLPTIRAPIATRPQGMTNRRRLQLSIVVGLAATTFAAGAEITERQKLLANDGAPGDRFGSSVAICGDTAVVGASFDNSLLYGAGAAYVYSWIGDAWVEQIELLASDGWLADHFGASVAANTDTLVVGAPDAGAYVFVRQGSTWVEEAKLTPSDSTFDDQFGTSVDIFEDTIVVGAHLKDTVELNDGAAYVFVRNGTSWIEQAKLTASTPASSDYFGWSVAISGDTIVVGAFGTDDPDIGFDIGAAYVFVRDGIGWTETTKLVDPDASSGDRFGRSVDVDGDVAVVGVDRDAVAGVTAAGSALVWHLVGDAWRLNSRLTARKPGASDLFGASVAVSDDKILVGSSQSDTAGLEAGSTHLFYHWGNTWTLQVEFIASDAAPRDNLGKSIAIDDSRVLGGANWDDDNGTDSGAAYAFLAPIRVFAGKGPSTYETRLSWIGGMSPFVLERSLSPGGPWQELTPPGGVFVRSWIDDAPLNDGTDYHYRVKSTPLSAAK